MAKRTAFVLIFDGFADWEPASALAELRRSFGFATRTVGLSAEPVTSMGGLRVMPDLRLAEFEPKQAEIFVLPGGDSWMAGEKCEVTSALHALVAEGRPVAGICAATLALAHAGLLNDRQHTSNGSGFIDKYVPAYRGKAFYRAVPAISDRGVITASGVAPIAFAAEIFRVLAPHRSADITAYEALYARGFIE